MKKTITAAERMNELETEKQVYWRYSTLAMFTNLFVFAARASDSCLFELQNLQHCYVSFFLFLISPLDEKKFCICSVKAYHVQF